MADIDLLLDLTSQTPDASLVGQIFEHLGERVSSACILIRPGISAAESPHEGWQISQAPEPVISANFYLKTLDASRHLLVLVAPVTVPQEAIAQLLSTFDKDPYFGVAIPRQFDQVTGEILKLDGRLGDPELGSFSRGIIEEIPANYILPEFVTSCFLIRNSVLVNFGFLDESYRTTAGAFLHYFWRARHCGFRCAVANRALVHVRANDRFHPSKHDTNRLILQHPDAGLAKTEFIEHLLHTHESLLGRALSPLGRIRRTLLIDARGIPKNVNGTTEAVLGICEGLSRINADWTITLACTATAAEAHKLNERFPNWEILSEIKSRYFTAAFRPSQPWSISSMADLHGAALFNFYTILDTIAWDILLQDTAALGAAWHFLSTNADGILYISQFTRNRFMQRFPGATTTAGYVSHLSFDPADYNGSGFIPVANERDDFILVFGNAFPHKDVRATVDLLKSKFDFVRIKAFGLEAYSDGAVEAFPSGEMPQTEIDELFKRAKAVVFPSFYEGFGFPVLKALSFGCTIVARDSKLLIEIAGHYRGPGRLIPYRTPAELVRAMTSILEGLPAAQLLLGTALADGEIPKSWKEIAYGVLNFIEEQAEKVSDNRWLRRQRAIEQFNAYCDEKISELLP